MKMVMVKALDNPDDVARIIQEDSPELLDATAQWLGEQLAQQGLTNSQIRNIFSTARQIEARRDAAKLAGREDQTRKATRREFILLKPKLAYQAARMNNRGVGTLKTWLSGAIDAAVGVTGAENEDTSFQNFMAFFEAILAYHYEAEQEKKDNNQKRRF